MLKNKIHVFRHRSCTLMFSYFLEIIAVLHTSRCRPGPRSFCCSCIFQERFLLRDPEQQEWPITNSPSGTKQYELIELLSTNCATDSARRTPAGRLGLSQQHNEQWYFLVEWRRTNSFSDCWMCIHFTTAAPMLAASPEVTWQAVTFLSSICDLCSNVSLL